MGRADQRTIAAGTPVSVLMERAGRAVAWEARRTLRGGYGRRVVIVCGKGNNGGDGLVAATALERWGVRVHVVELASGVDRRRLARALGRADLAIDAMYGTGFRGALEGDAGVVRRRARCMGRARWSRSTSRRGSTVSPARCRAPRCRPPAPSPSRRASPGSCSSRAGRMPGASGSSTSASTSAPTAPTHHRSRVTRPTTSRRLLPPRPPTAHKWMAGVMVVGGSGGMTGAPMFVSHAAMRAGAGIVWCGLPGDAAAARAVRFRGDHACASRHEGRRARAARRRSGPRRHLTVPRVRARARARLRPRGASSGVRARRRSTRPARARRRRPQRAQRRSRAAAHAPDSRRAHDRHAPRRRVRAPRGPTGRRRSDRGGAAAGRPQHAPSSC